MKSAVKLHPYIYNLLIEKNFDKFSSALLLEALIKLPDKYLYAAEARKFIRRQLIRLEKLGFLQKIEHPGGRTKALYEKTEQFYSTTFTPGKIPKNSRLNSITESGELSASDVDTFVTDLSNERISHEARLAVVLSEIEEYTSLMQRFPNRKRELMDLHEQARNQSATLLGRVTALTKALKLHTSRELTC
ncbi:hypothetical protein [Enterobacter kobei]|uniref:hypothetical protein n=1 Tax=Enterobacter kobei TaxID=208224 RepID=UPI003CF76CDB